MSNSKTAISAAVGLLLCQCAAAENRFPLMPQSFELISETVSSSNDTPGNPPTLIRRYQLEEGDLVELVHAVAPDGDLVLKASEQSEDTLTKMDRYCTRLGGEVVRTSTAKFTPETRTLLSCGKTGQSNEGVPRHSGKFLNDVSAAKASCSPTMSIVMDSNGSVYRGDPAGFAVHVDAEWDSVGQQMVFWSANFLPGCSLGETAGYNRWVWVSRAIVCPTGSLPVATHHGAATLSVCGDSAYDWISTEIWN